MPFTADAGGPNGAVRELALERAPGTPLPPVPPGQSGRPRPVAIGAALLAVVGLSSGYLVARNAQPAPPPETAITTTTTLLTIEATDRLAATVSQIAFTVEPAQPLVPAAAPEGNVVIHRFERPRSVALDANGVPWTSSETGITRWDPADGTTTDFAADQGIPPGMTLWPGSNPSARLWAGGDDTLLRFDGRSWWRHAPSVPWPDGGLYFAELATGPDGTVWALAADDRGMLLIGSRPDPLFAGTVDVIRVPNRLLYVHSLAIDGTGAAWLIGDGIHPPGMLGRYEAGVWTFFGGDPHPQTLAVGRDGVAWMSTSAALFSIEGESWSRLVFSGGADRSVLTTDPQGGLWAVQVSCCIGSDPHATLSRHDGGNWTVVHDTVRVPGLEWWGGPDNLAVGADGTVWLVSATGLHRYDGSTGWTTFAVEGGAPIGWATSAAVDDAGTLWVGDFDRLASFDGGGWSDRGSFAEVWGRTVREGNVFSGPDGTVWAWARGPASLARLDGSSWTSIDFPEAVYGVPANFALVAGDAGTLWLVGTDVLHHFDGSGWQPVGPGPGAELIGPVTLDECMSEAGWTDVEMTGVAVPSGSLWVGTCSGLLYFDGTAWSSPLRGVQVIAVETAPDGSLWAATSGGVWRFAGSWERVVGPSRVDPNTGRVDQEEDVLVRSLGTGADGAVWMAGDGLWRASNGTVVSVLEDVWIEEVVVGGDGTVWAIGDAVYQIIPVTARSTGGSS